MEFEKLRNIIVDNLGVDERLINIETDFVHDLGADSLALFGLAIAIEEEFHIEIAPEAMAGIRRVGDMVEYIGKAVR